MKKPLNAGDFDRKITIVDPEPIDTDADGFKTESETVVHECWAQVRNTSGGTIIRNDSDFERAYTRFDIRHTDKDIHKGQIVLYNGSRYRIEYVNDIDEAHVKLEIQTKKVVK